MMLDHLGHKKGGQRIRNAVVSALADGCHTPDLGGTLTTEQVGDAVAARLNA
jgi:isocitrate/isopropylmalate dehydrogenase